ncbi:MAG: hypothetical protein ACJAS1_006229 [Oleiphilaceae bacterium]|jgi:hypothetical protein
MDRLTKAQKDFLKHHQIPEHEVLDAHSIRTKDYKALMSEKGYRVAIGVTPCGKASHTMRGANGQCVMCKPANLMYRKRFRESGYVYIATTKERSGIIKVGYCQNVIKREASINNNKYGGYSNWKIRSSRKVKQKGPVEHAMHRSLAAFAYSSTYFHHNQEQVATELFTYDVDDAVDMLHQVKVSLDGNITVDPYKNNRVHKSTLPVDKQNAHPQSHSTSKTNNTKKTCSKNTKLQLSKPQRRIHEIDNRQSKQSLQQKKMMDNKVITHTEGEAKLNKYVNKKVIAKSHLFDLYKVRGNVPITSNEEPKSDWRWYHWLILFLAIKTIIILSKFGDRLFQ